MIRKNISPDTESKGYTAEEMNMVATEIREQMDTYYVLVLVGIFRSIKAAASNGEYETTVCQMMFSLDELDRITAILERKGYQVSNDIECIEEGQLYSVSLTISWK